MTGVQTCALPILAALAGLATIPAMAALARRMLNNDRAVVAVALATALAPLLLRYSQEARGYSPLLLLTVCYLILNWDLVQRGPSLWRCTRRMRRWWERRAGSTVRSTARTESRKRTCSCTGRSRAERRKLFFFG